MFWAAAASWYGKAAEHGDAFAQDRPAFQLAITHRRPWWELTSGSSFGKKRGLSASRPTAGSVGVGGTGLDRSA
jgi:hypothetical protein